MLRHMPRSHLAVDRLVGYELAESAFELMSRARHRPAGVRSSRRRPRLRSISTLMLLLDVIEHVEDPIGFLRSLRFKSDRTILHIPLDLSVQSVLRPGRLLHSRRAVGHLTTSRSRRQPRRPCGTAAISRLATRLTGGCVDLPAKSRKAAAAALPRRILRRTSQTRTLGRFSLLVLADNAAGGQRQSSSDRGFRMPAVRERNVSVGTPSASGRLTSRGRRADRRTRDATTPRSAAAQRMAL